MDGGSVEYARSNFRPVHTPQGGTEILNLAALLHTPQGGTEVLNIAAPLRPCSRGIPFVLNIKSPLIVKPRGFLDALMSQGLFSYRLLRRFL